jgi:hypothetical protein
MKKATVTNGNNLNSLDSLVSGNARLNWQLNPHSADHCHNLDIDPDNPGARIIIDHNRNSLDPLVPGNARLNWQLNPHSADHCHNLDTDPDNPGAQTVVATILMVPIQYKEQGLDYRPESGAHPHHWISTAVRI